MDAQTWLTLIGTLMTVLVTGAAGYQGLKRWIKRVSAEQERMLNTGDGQNTVGQLVQSNTESLEVVSGELSRTNDRIKLMNSRILETDNRLNETNTRLENMKDQVLAAQHQIHSLDIRHSDRLDSIDTRIDRLFMEKGRTMGKGVTNEA